MDWIPVIIYEKYSDRINCLKFLSSAANCSVWIGVEMR
jgi:hypothetical protein